MTDQKKKKWTVFFLIGFVDDHVEDMKYMLSQLLSIVKSPHLDIVLCLNIRAEKIPSNFPRSKTPVSKGWTTLFYSIECKKPGKCFLCPIEEKPDFDIRNVNDVSDFFKCKVLGNFLADEYMLFTWDHGQPFGIFPHFDDFDNVSSQLASIPHIVANKQLLFKPHFLHFRLHEFVQQQMNMPLLRKNEHIVKTAPSPGTDNIRMLTITELRNAIVWAFGKKKIAIVSMMNCYLQFFDTGYELSHCVNYLVAFETEMFFRNGLDYYTLFNLLSDNPDISIEELVKLTVNSYVIKNNANRRAIANTALFANDLSWYPCLAKFIDELAKNLTKEISRYSQQIIDALDRCKYISPNIPEYCLIDFGNFIKCLYSEAPGLFPGAMYEFMNALLDKIVIASFIGEGFKNENSSSFISPSCFSIYFPVNSGLYRTSFLATFMQENAIAPTEFVQHFYWENFIESFISFQDSQLAR